MKNNEKKSSTIILDCTLRDGGYYNNWDFDPDVVERYLRSMQAVSVDVIEIGFRSIPKTRFRGPYYYSTDEFLEGIDLPSDPTIGVMINCKEFFSEKDTPVNLVRKLFRKADDSPIGLVRIAVNFNRALEAESIACTLKMLGYQVAINLMQAHDKKEDESEEEDAPLLGRIKTVLETQVETVRKSKRLTESAACLVLGDEDMGYQMRRMMEAAGQAVPESKPHLEVNLDHPLLARLDNEQDEERFQSIVRILFDQAALADGTSLAEPGEYVKRINQLIVELME